MADKQINFKISTDASQSVREVKRAHDALGSLEAKSSSLSSAISTHWRSIGASIAGAFIGREIVEFAKRSLDGAEGFNKLAQSTGTTVEEISGFTYAAHLADVSQEGLGMGLKKLSRGMMDAAAGTGDALSAFEAMGLTVKDANGGLKTTGDMLLEVSEKFAGYEDSAGKTALAMKIFGRSGADLIPLLNQGKAGLAEAAKEGKAFGVVIGNEAAAGAERFNDNLKRLKDGALSGFVNKVMAELLPTMEKYSEELVKSAKNQETLEQAAKNAATSITSVAEKMKVLLDIYALAPPELVEAAGYGILGRLLFGGWGPAKIIAAMTIINDLASKSLNFGVQDFPKKYQGATGAFQNILDAATGKRDWRTGEIRSQAVGVDYEPHGFPTTGKTTPAPLLPDKGAASAYESARQALEGYRSQIEAMNPSLSEWDKKQGSLETSTQKLRLQLEKYPALLAQINDMESQGKGFLDLDRELKINEENAKLSEEIGKNIADRLQKELDLKLMLVDIDSQRSQMALDFDRKSLEIGMRYGHVSPGQGAAGAFDMDIRRLEITKNQLGLQIQQRSEAATLEDTDYGITKLLFQQKAVQEEINMLLNLRTGILKEHNGTGGEGFNTGIKNYLNQFSEFKNGERLATELAQTMHSAMEEFFFDPMKFSWENLWNSLRRIAAKSMADMVMDWFNTQTQMTSGGGGGQNIALGNTVDEFSFHQGGPVRRMHRGGLMSDEVPAILQTGEYVMSRKQVAAMKSGGGGTTVNNVTINATDAQSFTNMLRSNPSAIADAVVSAGRSRHPAGRRR
jgi:hypothetical protein